MRIKHSFLFIILCIICAPLSGQTISFEELEFEADSIVSPYKSIGKNFVYIRSKRGNSGVVKTSRADSIIAFPVTEIVLVFSELNSSAITDRENANRERWGNLLKTYPEYFQFSTTYKNLCQCNNRGDSASFKQLQGFYIYFTGEEPKAAEKLPVSKAEKIEEKKAVEKEVVVADKPKGKIKEQPAKEKQEKEKQEKETVKESDSPEANKGQEETLTISEKDLAKEGSKKKVGYTKPRRAKDAKACRPPCYENGDEDLNTFFKENISLSKKQRRHGKQLTSVLKIQLNFDGSVKKAMVTGANEILNQQVLGAVKMMNQWNPAVKNGVTVKSEVKITLNYDRSTKAMKPFEVAITPRPAIKCKCTSDAELFGSSE